MPHSKNSADNIWNNWVVSETKWKPRPGYGDDGGLAGLDCTVLQILGKLRAFFLNCHAKPQQKLHFRYRVCVAVGWRLSESINSIAGLWHHGFNPDARLSCKQIRPAFTGTRTMIGRDQGDASARKGISDI